MVTEQARKHLYYMQQLQTDRRHKEEEEINEELDRQKDIEYIQQITSKYSM